MRASAVLRSCVMRRTLLALLSALALAALHPARVAGAPAAAAVDSSQLIVFENDLPVATERNVFQNMGDSLVVVATTHRSFQDEHGTRHPLQKSMMLVVDSRDLGLIRYLSTQEFNDHEIVRGLIPGDTSITYYIELDGGGNADAVANMSRCRTRIERGVKLAVADEERARLRGQQHTVPQERIFGGFDDACPGFSDDEHAVWFQKVIALAGGGI